ncbi:MAG: DUF975 family protein [Sarcina sp.]
MTRKELKMRAKENLKDKWGLAIAVMVVFLILTQIGILYTFASTGSFLSGSIFQDLWIVFTEGAFLAGICMFNLSLARKNGKFSKLFEGFKIYPKALGAWILFCLIGILSIVGSVILAITIMAGVFQSILSYAYNVSFSGLGITLTIISVIVAIIFIVLSIILTYMFSQVFFIMANNDKKSVGECFAESKSLMKGNKFRLFVLQISFIWWYLLCGITGGLALIFVGPYISQTMALFYLEISGQLSEESSIDDLSDDYNGKENFYDLHSNKSNDTTKDHTDNFGLNLDKKEDDEIDMDDDTIELGNSDDSEENRK